MLAHLLTLSLVVAPTLVRAIINDNTFFVYIYTPHDEKYRVATLNEDWTINTRSKTSFESFFESESRMWKIRHVLTGTMGWARNKDPVPRSFWITDTDTTAWNRDMIRVITSHAPVRLMAE